MKKISKYLFLIILLLVILIPNIFVKAEDSNYKNGDLRCKDSDIKSGICKEYRNSDNEVIRVEITEKQDAITLTKIVEKDTFNIGNYNISFNIKGATPKNNLGDVYVVVLFDTSKTFENNIENAIKAIMNFSNKFKDNKNYHLALVQFAGSRGNNYYYTKHLSGNTYQRKFYDNGFKNNYFCGYKDSVYKDKNGITYGKWNDGCKGSMGLYSHVEAGLQAANNLFRTVDKNALKYIVLFGDGDYDHYENWTGDWKKEVCSLANNYGDTLNYIGILYPGGSSQNRETIMKQIVGLQNINYNNCNGKRNTGKVLKTTKDEQALIKVFEDAAQEIEIIGEKYLFSGILKDNIGADFNYVVDNKNVKVWSKSFENINNITTEKFTISIDSNSNGTWHDTNDSFSFKYDNNTKTISSKANPEVYWVNNYEYKSCTDTSINIDVNTKKELGTINYKDKSKSYYKYTCKENIKSQLYINNSNESVKTFSKKEKLGIPITVNLSTTITCKYSFDTDEFKKDKRYYEEEYKKATNQKDKNSIKDIIEQFDKIEKEYNNALKNNKNELNEYKNRFTEQNATLTIKYNDKETELLNNAFVNDGDVIEKNNYCNNSNSECTTTFEKKLILKRNCLIEPSGEKVECNNNANNLINGGNKYYLKSDKKSANISVKLTSLGINQSAMIDMKDETNPACHVDIYNNSIIYRQIKLSDPFLQKQTNIKRYIGHNWNSNELNFVKIIDDKIWDKTFDYQFDISKVNIENIKKDTSQNGVNSYLGTNCKFENNEFFCPFVRKTTNENNNYFTNIR